MAPVRRRLPRAAPASATSGCGCCWQPEKSAQLPGPHPHPAAAREQNANPEHLSKAPQCPSPSEGMEKGSRMPQPPRSTALPIVRATRDAMPDSFSVSPELLRLMAAARSGRGWQASRS